MTRIFLEPLHNGKRPGKKYVYIRDFPPDTDLKFVCRRLKAMVECNGTLTDTPGEILLTTPRTSDVWYALRELGIDSLIVCDDHND